MNESFDSNLHPRQLLYVYSYPFKGNPNKSLYIFLPKRFRTSYCPISNYAFISHSFMSNASFYRIGDTRQTGQYNCQRISNRMSLIFHSFPRSKSDVQSNIWIWLMLYNKTFVCSLTTTQLSNKWSPQDSLTLHPAVSLRLPRLPSPLLLLAVTKEWRLWLYSLKKPSTSCHLTASTLT